MSSLPLLSNPNLRVWVSSSNPDFCSKVVVPHESDVDDLRTAVLSAFHFLQCDASAIRLVEASGLPLDESCLVSDLLARNVGADTRSAIKIQLKSSLSTRATAGTVTSAPQLVQSPQRRDSVVASSNQVGPVESESQSSANWGKVFSDTCRLVLFYSSTSRHSQSLFVP